LFSRTSDGTLIDGRNFDHSSKVLRVVEFVFLALLLVEMAVGLIAWGFLGRGSWLRRSNFHVLDAAIFCCSILDLGMRTFGGLALIPVHSLRFLRIFKSLFRLPGFSAGRALLMSLDKAASKLLCVLALVLVFFLGFAAYGTWVEEHLTAGAAFVIFLSGCVGLFVSLTTFLMIGESGSGLRPRRESDVTL
jgi:hypothetical protein